MTAVAQTILQQLGGSQFVLLTGAKDFITNGNDLTMTLPRGGRLRVTLNGSDLYDLDYFGIRGMEVKSRGSETDIYCDGLKDAFERLTGLYVTLAPRRAA